MTLLDYKVCSHHWESARWWQSPRAESPRARGESQPSSQSSPSPASGQTPVLRRHMLSMARSLVQACHLAMETDRSFQSTGGQWDLDAKQAQWKGAQKGPQGGPCRVTYLSANPWWKYFVFPNSSPDDIFNISKTLTNKCKCFLRSCLSGLGSPASGRSLQNMVYGTSMLVSMLPVNAEGFG